jgi:Ca2+ transporting ATPase
LSENESLLTLPVWNNIWLVLAIGLSMILHFMILYVPFFQNIFHTVPLNFEEWWWVVAISIPVIFLDEGLKWYSRHFVKSYKRKSQ